MLDHVRVLHFNLDAIRALDAGVMIDRCSVTAPAGPLTTGVLISYSMGRPMSMVSRCTIVGVREGIATHSSMVDVMDNHVDRHDDARDLAAEMSMDMASGNQVESARGIGIICMDHSMCEIEHNTIAGAQVDGTRQPEPPRRRDRVVLLRRGAGRAQHRDREPGRRAGVRQLDDRRATDAVPHFQLVARTGHPSFLDLPWDEPLEEWKSPRIVNLIRGISRHVVRFVEYDGALYALKELPERPARREWTLLRRLEGQGLPVVEAVGIVTERDRTSSTRS